MMMQQLMLMMLLMIMTLCEDLQIRQVVRCIVSILQEEILRLYYFLTIESGQLACFYNNLLLIILHLDPNSSLGAGGLEKKKLYCF